VGERLSGAQGSNTRHRQSTAAVGGSWTAAVSLRLALKYLVAADDAASLYCRRILMSQTRQDSPGRGKAHMRRRMGEARGSSPRAQMRLGPGSRIKTGKGEGAQVLSLFLAESNNSRFVLEDKSEVAEQYSYLLLCSVFVCCFGIPDKP
jgi:hypothetical protein